MRMKSTSVYIEAKLLIATQPLNITVAVESAQKKGYSLKPVEYLLLRKHPRY